MKAIETAEHMHGKHGRRIVRVVANCPDAPGFYHGHYAGFPIMKGSEVAIHLNDGSVI